MFQLYELALKQNPRFFLYFFFLAVSLGLSKNSLCVSELPQWPHFFILMQLMVPGSVKRIKNGAHLRIVLSCTASRPSSHISARATSELTAALLEATFHRNHPQCRGKRPGGSVSEGNPSAVVTMP